MHHVGNECIAPFKTTPWVKVTGLSGRYEEPQISGRTLTRPYSPSGHYLPTRAGATPPTGTLKTSPDVSLYASKERIAGLSLAVCIIINRAFGVDRLTIGATKLAPIFLPLKHPTHFDDLASQHSMT